MYNELVDFIDIVSTEHCWEISIMTIRVKTGIQQEA